MTAETDQGRVPEREGRNGGHKAPWSIEYGCGAHSPDGRTQESQENRLLRGT